MEINTEEYWRDGYAKLHKEYSFTMRENKHMKCQIDLLVHDKMVLENKVEGLQKEIDFWKMIYQKTYNETLELKLELEEEKQFSDINSYRKEKIAEFYKIIEESKPE